MNLTQDQIEFFKTNGYLIYNQRVLDEVRVESLKERMEQVMSGRSDGAPERIVNLLGGDLKSDQVVVQIVNIWEADDLFRELVFDENIVKLTAQLMETDTVRLWHDQIQYKPPVVGAPTDWHQDHPANKKPENKQQPEHSALFAQSFFFSLLQSTLYDQHKASAAICF